MNRIYKTVWNEQTGTFVAASEITRSRSKRSGGAVVAATVLAASMGLGGVAVAQVGSVTGITGQIVVTPTGADGVTIGLDSEVTDAIQSNTNAIDSKADQTDLDAATSRIITNEDDIGALQSGKADQSDLDTATNRITVNEGDIGALQSSKADQTSLDAATSRITTNEGNISTLQSGKADLSALEATDLKADQLGGDAASIFGGGATYDSATGAITLPIYTITTGDGDTQEVRNVGDALALMNGFDPSGGTVDATGIKYFHVRSQKADSQARGEDSTAIGPLARVDDSSAAGIAMGLGAQVNQNSENTIAIGTGAKSDPVENPAGSGTYDPAKDSVAIGTDATVTGSDAVAMGHESSAGTGSVGIGQGASAHGGNALAAGAGAKADAAATVALGSGAQALTENSISIGKDAGEDSDGNVADTRRDLINIGRQAGQNVEGRENIAIGLNAGSGVKGDQNIAMGTNAGTNFADPSINNVSLGFGANRNAGQIDNAVAVGALTRAATDSVAIGFQSQSTNSGIAIGRDAQTIGTGGVALGFNTQADGNFVALGQSARATTSDVVGNGYITGQAFSGGAVSVGNAQGTTPEYRRVVNVADGAQDRDAVNVRQLQGAQQAVATMVGGGMTVDPTSGAFSGFKAIGSDGSVVQDDDGNEVVFSSVSQALGDLSSGNLTISAGGSGNIVTYNGAGQINNVTAGSNPTDAVNVQQLSDAVEENKTHYYHVNSDPTAADGQTVNYNNNGATGINASAMGPAAQASGNEALAVGLTTTAAGTKATAIGNHVTADGASSTAIGTDGTRAWNDRTVAIGSNANAHDENSIVIGTGALSNRKDSTGPGVQNSIVIGTSARSSAEEGIAVGLEAVASGERGIAQGHSALASEEDAQASGSDSEATAARARADGTRAIASAGDAFAIGTDSGASAGSAYAIGNAAKARATNSFAVGTRAETGNQAADSIAMGTESTVIGRESIAVGAGNTIGQTDTDGDGNPILVGNRSGAFGNDNTILQDNTFVVGNNVTTTQANSVVLGDASTDRAATSETSNIIDGLVYSYAGSGAPEYGVVSVGQEDKERQIINVAAGKVSADSTDAINGSQLYATNVVLGNVANTTVGILGGDAELGSGGRITMTDIGSTGKDTVHEAIQVARTEVVAGTNVASASKTQGADGHDIYTINADGASVSAGSGAVAVAAGTKDASNITDYAVDLSQASKDSLGKADTAMQGFTTAVGGTTAQTLDQANTQANFIAGDNIQLTGDAGGITVATVADPNFTTVTTTGAITAGGMLNANGGLTVAAGQTVDMGGNQITNVAAGVGDTDAVNVSQLQQTAFNAGQNGPVVYTDVDGNKVAKANDGNWYDASVVNPDGSLIGSPTQVTEVIASMQSADGSTTDPTTLANVAAGKAGTDAVNVSQLGAALGGDSIDADGNYVGPTYNILGDTYNNVGDAIAASTTHYYSVNSANQAAGSNYLNDGATGVGALAAGVFAQAAGSLGTAVGPSANSTGDRSAAVGYDAIAVGESSIALGASARVQQSNSVALGAGSEANEGQHTGAFTIDGSTAAGLTSGAAVVSIGTAGAERQIQNVAPGVLSATSTDAINGSQLHASNLYIGNVAGSITTVLGGDAALGDDGSITMTDIGGTGKDNIHDAIEAATSAANAGWNYTANGSDETKVGPDGDVDFGNDDGNIVVSKSTDGLNFDLAPVLTIGPATGGNPVTIDGTEGTISGLTNTTFDATDPSQYSGSGQAATEGQLHDLAVAGLDFAGDTGSGVHRDLGQTLTVQGGATGPLSSGNIGVNADGNTLAVQLAENIDLGPDGSVTTGDTVMNGSGVTVDDGAGNSSKLTTGGLEVADGTNTTRYGADGMVIDGGPSVTSDGIDAGNKQVTGVASGMTDSVGNAVTDLDDAVDTNAANIGDLKQAVSGVTDAGAGGGFGLADENGNAFMQDLGTSTKITGGGQNIKTAVVPDGTGSALQVSLADQLVLGQTESAPGAGDGEDGSLAVRGQDGVAGVDLNGADGSISLTNADGDTTSLRVVQGPANLDDTAAGASQRLEYTDANGDPQQVATLNDGLIFGANDGADHSAKLNTQVNVMGADANTDFSRFDGGANIMTQMQGDTVRVALARDLDVDSVNAGGTVIDSGGLYFVDAQGGRRDGAPSVGPQGMDAGGHKITNVAIGTAPSDAVNVEQLGNVQRHVTDGQVMYDQHPDGSTDYESVTLNPYGEAPVTVHNVAPGRAGTDAVNVNQLNALNNNIIRNDRRASAGIAAAIATAGLPQAYLPGKSMFGVAAGTWRGETGFAMGLSRVSDNGRWIIKGTATGSSRGDYGGSVGVGFQW